MACLDGNSPQAGAQYALHGPGANRRQISANILTRLHGLDQYAVLSFNRHPAYFTHPDNAGQHLIGSLDPLDRDHPARFRNCSLANVELADRLADFETEPDILHLPGSRALARNGTGTSQQAGRNLMRAYNRDAMSLEQFHQA